MAQKTHPLLVQASESEEAGEVESRGIREMLGRLSRQSRSKLAGYIRVGSVALTSCVWLAWSSCAIAQIIPDEAWGAEQSVLTPLPGGTLADFLIKEGARRDSNLFHSFTQFDIGEQQRVYFDSPQGIENIFSRVKGNNASDILGTLGVNGGANLFLINSNGIIFGDNASLDVQGSFVATTANGIQFGEQGFFSTTQSEPPSALLTVNPSAFLFNQITPGRIESRSIKEVGVDPFGFSLLGLQVPDGQSLLLVGGDILIDGQMNFGGLAALEGRLELAAVAGSGTVGLSVDNNTLSLNIPPEILQADISLTNGAYITTAGEAGGDIQLWGRQIILASDFTTITSSSVGASNAGNLVVNASELVQARGDNSGFFATSEATATGGGGDVTITTPELQLMDGAQIATATRGAGKGGNIVVNASELVQAHGDNSGFFATSEATATGGGGDVTITTPELQLMDGAQIATATRGAGKGGNIVVNASELVQAHGDNSGFFATSEATVTGGGGDVTITTPELQLMDGAQIATATRGIGNAGNVVVNASELVQVSDSSDMFASGLRTDTLGEGDAGDLTINTPVLVMENGAVIASGTSSDSTGKGGTLTVNASALVQLSNEAGQFSTLLTTRTEGQGNGGNLTINTPKLVVTDESQVSAETFASGIGGLITVNANTVEVTNGGQLRTTTEGSNNAGNISLQVEDSLTITGEGSGLFADTKKDSSGNGGSIMIDSRTVVVRGRGQITVESEGIGTGGNISLEADSLILDTNAGLLADTDANTGGNIVLTIDDLLLLRRDSRISTNAGKDEERGDGGNIIIEAVFIVAVPNENSDITANAFEGQGGNVTITTQGLFNLVIRSREELEALLGTKEPSELDPMNLQSNDITAISQTSPELSRIPILIVLELDPSQGLVELPAELVDVTRLVEQNLCAAAQGSEFIVTGRGGLPTPPNQMLNADAAWEDWRISTVEESTEVQQSNRNSRQDVTGNKPNKFVEAQGWFKDANGTIILTAEPTVVTPHATGSPSFPCQ
ncbi:filamentous haemagglutinin family N-terminal domain protein [Coleofasciculus chthonoplastes PCC 7420]|uniref:Filamentous haemagglutinin family N-terminal domain protein n=1 Tax=Coleofasciculus chthonoplastes PCC 7420 TaxID=118168 RepID=B4VNL7_9CYAN|nr:S-layer family protein [Coleofasciculus chthonoplastes]EDX76452.1 filamentous haemagglutinin family N-terminal domain protein [Coleofasciculus chthonoplastes PCC 7420]